MAPFTNRQIGYIRAVAGQSRHDSFRVFENSYDLHDSREHTGAEAYRNWVNKRSTVNGVLKNFYAWCWELNETAIGATSKSTSNNITTVLAETDATTHGFNNMADMHLLQCPVADLTYTEQVVGDNHQHVEDKDVSTLFRASPTAFLKSTHMKFRFTMPDYVNKTIEDNTNVNPMHTPHYEWRFIIFRNKRPTLRRANGDRSLEKVREGVSLHNPGYDLFMGLTGRPRGPLGWRAHHKFDKVLQRTTDGTSPHATDAHTAYQGYYWDGAAWQTQGDLSPPGEQPMCADDAMTFPLNRNDYVIHTDDRFFLGQQFGKSHYEKVVHFDWNDLIETEQTNMTTSPTLDRKNYEWRFMLIGTANGGDDPELNVRITGVTHVQSGD